MPGYHLFPSPCLEAEASQAAVILAHLPLQLLHFSSLDQLLPPLPPQPPSLSHSFIKLLLSTQCVLGCGDVEIICQEA